MVRRDIFRSHVGIDFGAAAGERRARAIERAEILIVANCITKDGRLGVRGLFIVELERGYKILSHLPRLSRAFAQFARVAI